MAGEPDWFKQALSLPTPAVPSDAPAMVLFQRIDLRVEADLSAELRHVLAIRILRSSGLDYAIFAVTVPPGGTLKRFNVWSFDGHARRSQANRANAVETTLMPGVYTDTRRILLRVPGARAGDIVAAEYTLEERLWFPSYEWFPQPDGLGTARTEMAIELPRDWRVEAHGMRVTPHQSGSGGNVREFSIGPLDPIPIEAHAPPRRDVVPVVHLRFLDPEGTKTFPDWKSVAIWYQALSAPRYDPGQAPKELLLRAVDDDSARVVLALAREVQRSIHYAAIELGLQGWIPDAAGDTWQRRYGDCKDKATLLVAALGARGIVARPVLVCTRSVQAVNPDAPDPGQFNHVIVAIRWPGNAAPAGVTSEGPSGRAWTFFDPTDPFTPLGMLPGDDAGTWAVIADSSEGLVRLPAAKERSLRVRTHMRITQDGDLSGTVTLTGGGAVAAVLTRDFNAASNDQRKQRAADWLRSSSSQAEVSGVRWSGLDSTSFSATVDVDVRLTGGARPAGDAWLIRPLYFGGARFAAPEDTSRTLPFMLGGPATYEDRFELDLPAGSHADGLPTVEWSDPIGDYQLSGEATPASLVLTRRLSFHEDAVPAVGYSSVRQLLQHARAGDTAPIVLRR
jgi:Domain of Unknown Function with PDB structure (DUF3857)/Transglutaminase-like superfamily